MPRSRKSIIKNDENQDPSNLQSPVRSKLSKTSIVDFDSPKTIRTPLSVSTASPGAIMRRQILSPFSKGTGSTPTTPIRQRSDIRVDSKIRQLSIDRRGLSDTHKQTLDSNENKFVIWGTDVVLSECKTKLSKFLKTFIPTYDDSNFQYDVSQPLYMQKISEIQITQKPYLVIDGMHLKTFDSVLYYQLLRYPQEVIPAFDSVVNDIFVELFNDVALEHQIQIRVMNIDHTKNMRYLNPDDIDQLINISGMVIRTSCIIPEMQEAYYQCYICKNGMTAEVNAGRIVEPNVCSSCNTSHTMVLVHNRSVYTDKQVIKIQESPDEMPPGQTPYHVLSFAYNDLVDQIQPGDRVTITGIYRVIPTKVNPRQSVVRSVYKTYIDVIHFLKHDKSRLHPDGVEKLSLSEERIEKILNLSKSNSIYEKLAHALAPSVYGNLDVKKGLLLQLFAGTRKEFTQSGRSHFRSELNVLLCGDPGTCKSQLLKYMHGLLPRGQYTSGKGSSAVGLTAYITRDPDTRQLILQTGALVLSDNGICCIDEFDKMSESTRSVLHEVMEQQTLSIAKAGIICQLNARASILAAANPVKSRWDTKLTTIENIQMPHTLLSRFDLIFLILDHQSEVFDKNLANHLVSLYQKTPNIQSDIQAIDLALIKDYIAYAREHIHPKLTEEAADHLIQSYTEMRRFGNQHGSISAYPRQLESLIRLSEAHAKVRLSNKVEVPDVIEAMRLHKEALMQSSIDPKTGMIDVNILAAGFSESDRKVHNELCKLVKSYLESQPKTVTVHQYNQLISVIRKTFNSNISSDLFDSVLRSLEDDHIITFGAESKTIRYIVV